jgi:uncharacterized cupin superfamily protein
VFGSDWDFQRAGVAVASVTRPGGAELLGATAYELEPGARWADLHVHYANEELIVVLDGRLTVHTFAGPRELERGDVLVCPRGRRGAHRIENTSGQPTRVLIVSTMKMPELVEYPEQGRVFAMTEPPYTEAAHDPEEHGRLLRVFSHADGVPVPPDG